MEPTELKLFKSDHELCFINNLKAYLEKTKPTRKDTALLISYYNSITFVFKETVAKVHPLAFGIVLLQ